MYTHVCQKCGKEFKNSRQNTKYCSSECYYNSKYIDISGKRFGRLVALQFKERKNKKETIWICKCDCGNITETPYTSLVLGRTKSCGCLNKEFLNDLHKKNTKYPDLVGRKFHNLTVIEKTAPKMWKCSCICGNITNVSTNNLVKGITKSCGCLSRATSKMLGQKVMKEIQERNFKDGTDLALLCRNKLFATNTSGVTGVYFYKKSQKWRAYITFQRKCIHLGTFTNKIDAIKARKKAEEKYFKPVLDKYNKESKETE